MTDEELTRGIAEALGCKIRKGAIPLVCDHGGSGHRVPDYANDLNASMAVIRERWPDGTVVMDGDDCWIFGDFEAFRDWSQRVDTEYVLGYGPTLAAALLEALEGRKDD